MTVNEYQTLARRTLNWELDKKDILINGVMGLCGESGEVIDIVKSIWHPTGPPLQTGLGHPVDCDTVYHCHGTVWHSESGGEEEPAGQVK